MGERLKGKVAIVTGSGRGLGRAEALALAAEGAKVVVNDLGVALDGSKEAVRPADEVVAEIKKMGGEAAANYDSVATWQGGENIIKAAIDNFGRLDILVNNAGIVRDRFVYSMSAEEWDAVIKTHLYGTFHCTRAACVIFREQRSGRIINTSSEAGMGNAGQPNYSAAKEGIVGFTRTVAREMGPYGVTCNAIRPRAATRMTMSEQLMKLAEKARASGDPVQIAQAEQIEALQKMTPEDVAPLVVYLATDEAANVNGCVFLVRGNIVTLQSDPLPVKTIEAKGKWTVDALAKEFPKTIGQDLVNPAPPRPSVITKQMREYLGKELEPAVFEIEKGAIKKLADSVEDPNALWQDEAYAKKTEYGGIIASPTFIALLKPDSAAVLATLECPLPAIMDGGIEIEYREPIKPGDIITVTPKLADISEKEGRTGKMLFMIVETTYKNQKGRVAVITRQTAIRR
jgi:NAD(P)-dependent dehydrogenase (short-subunit alcohol dehydrogenase family)